jgi:phenylpyruvate tautomerase PptA (4-oxalocrotonate tautomerase family)
MPIIDVEAVCDLQAQAGPVPAQALADACAQVLSTGPGRTWVRLRWLDANDYAENATALAASDWPVFVTVLHRQPPQGAALQQEVTALTTAIAALMQRSPERVHVQYAPAAAGRQAFGGRLVE